MTLFSAHSVGAIPLRNRIAMAPMTRSRAAHPELAPTTLPERQRCNFSDAPMECGGLDCGKARAPLAPWHANSFHTGSAEGDINYPPLPAPEPVAHRQRRHPPTLP